MGPVIKLGWARNNNTVDTLECGECDGTTLICWRGFSHEQSARQTGNFLWDGGARRADGQREKKSPTEVRVATKRAELVVVVVVGSVARKCGDRNRQNNEHFACAHRHNAVSVQGSITHTIVRALLHNMQGCASSQGRIWTARCRRHAHAAGAGAYRSRFAVEIDFQGSAIRTAARGEAQERARFEARGSAPGRSMTPSAVRTTPPRGGTQMMSLDGLAAAPQGRERIESSSSHGGRSAANPIHNGSIAPGSWAPAREQRLWFNVNTPTAE